MLKNIFGKTANLNQTSQDSRGELLQQTQADFEKLISRQAI